MTSRDIRHRWFPLLLWIQVHPNAISLSLSLIAALLLPHLLSAQAYDENQLGPQNAVGLVPYSSLDGLHEDISLASGALNITIPILSLPQRGGRPLTLAYIYNSKTYALQEAQFVSGGGGNSQQGYSYIFAHSLECSGCNPAYPIQLNLPTLRADLKYIGTYLSQIGGGINTYPTIDVIDPDAPSDTVNLSPYGNGQNGTIYGYPMYCVTGWTFSDWSGAKHSFGNMRDCPIETGTFSPDGVPLNLTTFGSSNLNESEDASFIRLDTSNPNDIIVTERDGTQYHFANYKIPSGQPTDWPYYYYAAFSTMVDPNGNTISYNASNATLTDTLNRTISLTANGIQYQDSQGNNQSVSLTATPSGNQTTYTFTNPPTNPTLGFTSTNNPCYMTGPFPGGNELAYTVGFGQWNVTGPEFTTATILFPGGREYVLTFDVLGQLRKIQYPGGGYTRYSYTANPGADYKGQVICTDEFHEVSAKHVCNLASGSCSPAQEATTTYSPRLTYENAFNGMMTYNTEMDVTDPLDNLTKHIFDNLGSYEQYTSPRETYTYIYAGDSTLLRTIHTTYVPNTVSGPGLDFDYPQTVTTTYNDTAPALVKTTTYTYDTQMVPSPPRCQSAAGATNDNASCPTSSILINNPTLIQETDFTGSITRTTSQQWEKGGQYDGGTGHILDRLHSRTVTDNTTGISETTTFNHDSIGNLTQRTISGTNAVSQPITYTPLDSWGRPTQTTDGLSNVATYSYSDSWADTTCAPATDSKAYLTSVTNAKGQKTSYKYYSCTGLLASVTDPNSQAITYQYDGLGRVANIAYPDGGSKTNSYTDTPPNSVQTTIAQSGATNQVQALVLDGLSHKSESQLTDPYGEVKVDTTYDPNERVSSVSNPYRSIEDRIYGITQFSYDALDRKTKQIQADGSATIWWCYNNTQDVLNPQPNCRGNASSFSPAAWVDEQNENGGDWQHVSDALDHVRAVVEPYSMETDYGYDALDNLLSVNQKGASGSTAMARSFSYTGLSQLLSAYNPESGTVCYGVWNSGNCANGYDADGNLVVRTDARGVVTNYGYDVLNRLVTKTYSSDPAATLSSCYQYDAASTTYGVGRLGFEWTQPGSCPSPLPTSAPSGGYQSMRVVGAYDQMGRIATEQQCVLGYCTSPTPPSPPSAHCTALPATNGLSYCYDFAGNLTAYSNGVDASAYPQQAIPFSQQFDSAGRLDSVYIPSTPATPWISSPQLPANLFTANPTNGYTASGELQNWMLGTNLNVTRSYDNRQRVTGETATQP